MCFTLHTHQLDYVIRAQAYMIEEFWSPRSQYLAVSKHFKPFSHKHLINHPLLKNILIKNIRLAFSLASRHLKAEENDRVFLSSSINAFVHSFKSTHLHLIISSYTDYSIWFFFSIPFAYISFILMDKVEKSNNFCNANPSTHWLHDWAKIYM